MSTEAEFDWDSLGEREGNFSAGLLELLADVQWAAPLLAGIRDAGGVRRDTKSLLFELRFANALQEAGVVAEYEIPGEGDSRIDFGFTSNGQRWAVELLRLAETAAVQAATRNTVDGDEVVWSSRALRTNAEDARQSEEGEMLKVVQRICQKCERGYRYSSNLQNSVSYLNVRLPVRASLHLQVWRSLDANSTGINYRL